MSKPFLGLVGHTIANGKKIDESHWALDGITVYITGTKGSNVFGVWCDTGTIKSLVYYGTEDGCKEYVEKISRA